MPEVSVNQLYAANIWFRYGINMRVICKSESLFRAICVKLWDYPIKNPKSESLMKQITSKSGLAIVLSRLKGFENPKVRTEQYITDPEIAADMLWKCHMLGDIGKVSVDLGAGTGILGLGLLLLGAEKVYMVESEGSAIKIAKINYKWLKSEFKITGKAVFQHKDIKDFNKKTKNVNLVVQNPPFGTKIKHSDRIFLEKAFEIADIVYSFHKTSTKSFIKSFSTENNFEITHFWHYDFPLKATQSFHKKKIQRINVGLWRFKRKSF